MPTEAYPGQRHLDYWMTKLREPRFVYVIRARPDPPIKVGYARDVACRMRELQTGNPRRLCLLYVVPGNRDLEARLHRRAGGRMVGEWFDGTESFLSFVADLSERMIQAHDLSGLPPDWRQFDPRWMPPVDDLPSVSTVMSRPVSEEEKQRRLKAWHLRPTRYT